jgi:hypothetical protein
MFYAGLINFPFFLHLAPPPPPPKRTFPFTPPPPFILLYPYINIGTAALRVCLRPTSPLSSTRSLSRWTLSRLYAPHHALRLHPAHTRTNTHINAKIFLNPPPTFPILPKLH